GSVAIGVNSSSSPRTIAVTSAAPPIVLSPEEVLRFFSCVLSVKHRTILTICYAAGLRISEAISLKVSDVDSQRMVIRVKHGKGAKDRFVTLSPKLLEVLRAWWPVEK